MDSSQSCGSIASCIACAGAAINNGVSENVRYIYVPTPRIKYEHFLVALSNFKLFFLFEVVVPVIKAFNKKK